MSGSFALSLLLLQAAAPTTLAEVELNSCLQQAANNPKQALLTADEWSKRDGGHLSAYCRGAALAGDYKFDSALETLTSAAQAAQSSSRPWEAAPILALAGNVAIAAGDPQKALGFLAQAEIRGENWPAGAGLSQEQQTQLLVDKALAYGLADAYPEARTALAAARKRAPQDAQIWLLSATLARRTDDLNAAQEFIATAAGLAPGDPQIALEAGNIAAAAQDFAQARRQWELTMTLAPQSRAADTAKRHLAQLGSSGDKREGSPQTR